MHKSLANPKLRNWLLAPAAFVVLSWSRGKGERLWQPRWEEITVDRLKPLNREPEPDNSDVFGKWAEEFEPGF